MFTEVISTRDLVLDVGVGPYIRVSGSHYGHYGTTASWSALEESDTLRARERHSIHYGSIIVLVTYLY